jgi:2-oxoglutarate dehydrogenase E2 component (dihydrolipoamide succinyltransferase)
VRSFSGSTAEIKTPDFGAESITEGTLQEWQKKLGDYVAKGEILAVIETDKVSVEVKAEESGVLEAIAANVDDTVTVGQVLCVMKLGVEPPPKTPAAAKPEVAPVTSEKVAMAAAKPAETAPKLAPAKPKAETPVQAPSLPLPTGGVERVERRVKMNRMRQAISRRLKEAQNTAAMLTTFQEVDMGNLMEMRKEYKDLFEKTHGGVRLGFMSAFLKASSFALGQIPAVNALIDDKTQEIVYRDFVDISVAVASPKGLVVPVVRGVQGMSLFQIENSIAELAKKAKTESLTLEDSMGGTFTISNGGVFGSMMGTPIINPPQSAILGMHATKMRPVVMKNGEIKPRPIMFLALTYDHRLVDGREAVTFLCTVRDQIEDPRRLLLEL